MKWKNNSRRFKRIRQDTKKDREKRIGLFHKNYEKSVNKIAGKIKGYLKAKDRKNHII